MPSTLPGWSKALALSALLAVPALVMVAGRPSPPRIAADVAVVQSTQEPDVLNPYLSPMSAAGALAALFYSGLVTLDERGEWQPDLATEVPTLENGGVKLTGAGMSVTYRLRPEAVWHDGKPVTAEDAVATWKLLMDPAFPAVSTAGYELVEAVVARDARTVEVR
ncbi:MAG: ABC transporter substrate-binding protein, partial [Candidatus Sericytochromatia bacterium]